MKSFIKLCHDFPPLCDSLQFWMALNPLPPRLPQLPAAKSTFLSE